MAIEVDGPHHDLPHYAEIDRRRDYVLNRLGWTVYRFTADQAFNHSHDLARTIKNILAEKDNAVIGCFDPFV